MKNEADVYQMLMAVEEENAKLKHDRKKLEEEIRGYEKAIRDKEDEMNALKCDITESGNLAEFSIKISRVLESAENAAQEYVETNRRLTERSKQEADTIIAEALKQKDNIIKEAQAEARNIRKLNLNILQRLREEAHNIIDEVAEEKDLENKKQTKNVTEDGSKMAI